MKRASVPVAAIALGLLGCALDDPSLLDDDVHVGTDIAYSDALKDSTYRWPNGEIPFKIDGSQWVSPSDARAMIINSMARWQDLTRIDFVEVPGCSDCLQISGGGSKCESEIGTEPGELRFMHLPDSQNCITSRVVMHELGHVIGLRHEQQRSDRDLYITVHLENAADSADFEKDTSSSATEPVGDYDWSSVMHYRAFSHTKNGRMTLKRNDSWGLFDERKRMWRTAARDPVTALLVGDFDGDGHDDVVRHKSTGGWQMSRSAAGAWVNLSAPDAPPDQVRVGQFDGDPRADLVWASGTEWRFWSPAIDASWHHLFDASTTWATMRVVDFDGDGDSDFVRINNNHFQIALDGRAAFQDRPTAFDVPMALDDLLFGDFVGGPGTDALRRTPNTVGLEATDGLDGAFTAFRSGVPTPISSFRAFDKDGVGKDDLIVIIGDPDPDRVHYEVAPEGTGSFAPLDTHTDTMSIGVEDFDKLVMGDFDPATGGQEMLVNGYFPDRTDVPSHTDRGGVAHIYYPQVVLSVGGRDNWQYWDDASSVSNLAQYKVGDVDGDGKDDLFEVSTSWLGVTSTRYRRMDPDGSHASVGWHTLNANVGPASNIAIGNFLDEVGEIHPRMDVFRKNGNNWEIQSGGTGTWLLMMIDPTGTAVSQMAFADFDGDGITDIFKAATGGWMISWGGKTQFQDLPGTLNTSLSLLRFGDFTGDGKADVVASFSGAWWVSSAAATGWTKLRDDLSDIRTYRFGHFDDDNRLDVFRIDGTSWQILSGAGPGNWTSTVGSGVLASSAIASSSLAIGHFHGVDLHDDIIGFLPALADDNLNGW